ARDCAKYSSQLLLSDSYHFSFNLMRFLNFRIIQTPHKNMERVTLLHRVRSKKKSHRWPFLHYSKCLICGIETSVDTVVYNLVVTIRSLDDTTFDTSSDSGIANSHSFSSFTLTVICLTGSQIFDDIARMTISLNLSDGYILFDNTVYSHANFLTDIGILRFLVTNITLRQTSSNASDYQRNAVSYIDFPVLLNMYFHTFFSFRN